MGRRVGKVRGDRDGGSGRIHQAMSQVRRCNNPSARPGYQFVLFRAITCHPSIAGPDKALDDRIFAMVVFGEAQWGTYVLSR